MHHNKSNALQIVPYSYSCTIHVEHWAIAEDPTFFISSETHLTARQQAQLSESGVQLDVPFILSDGNPVITRPEAHKDIIKAIGSVFSLRKHSVRLVPRQIGLFALEFQYNAEAPFSIEIFSNAKDGSDSAIFRCINDAGFCSSVIVTHPSPCLELPTMQTFTFFGAIFIFPGYICYAD